MTKAIITKKKARGWISAINKLLRYYKADEYYPGDCPLCQVSWLSDCPDCLWKIYEGESCDIGLEDEPEDRIPRLNRWKARLNKIIKGGK